MSEAEAQTAPKRLPIPVTALDRAFGGAGGTLHKILPPMREIPTEYEGRDMWEDWQAEWFFRGLKRRPVPREGIDLNTALDNLAVVQGSFEPKHEHKQAGVAYLASLWFSSPNGDPIPEKQPA